MPQTVLIFGASSAIAKEAARGYAAQGYDLILAARQPHALENLARDVRARYDVNVTTELVDAAELSSVTALAARVATPHLTGVMSAVGWMPAATGPDAIALSALLNFAAPATLIEALAPTLIGREGAFITVITSVAGDRGRGSNYVYGSAKGGLQRYLEGLRHRLHGHGIQVTDVRPGFVDTPMTRSMKLPFKASALSVGDAVAKAHLDPKNTVYTPGFWRLIMLVIRALPETILLRSNL